MTSLAIRDEIVGFVQHILQWDYFTDIIDDHAETVEARDRITHGSKFLLKLS